MSGEHWHIHKFSDVEQRGCWVSLGYSECHRYILVTFCKRTDCNLRAVSLNLSRVVFSIGTVISNSFEHRQLPSKTILSNWTVIFLQSIFRKVRYFIFLDNLLSFCDIGQIPTFWPNMSVMSILPNHFLISIHIFTTYLIFPYLFENLIFLPFNLGSWDLLFRRHYFCLSHILPKTKRGQRGIMCNVFLLKWQSIQTGQLKDIDIVDWLTGVTQKVL